ncbi:hypothetical protein D2V93_02895 [Flagellimonas taeanensis]|uniref:ORC-CDC6 family AAA ATPase n=1 Tax=Flavobacteriaceae TaxID=49546 RepID=UPI000E6985E7|nr:MULTISPECIES: protein kinase [Allomuricauda]MDC6385378.1 hypothetical protein [Muricauda sp. SK9]RIV53102.1 hypothetical protein D2V93_02895 [Allomuricauda taeanensis]
MTADNSDYNIGISPWKDYVLTEYKGKGKTGRVYKAVRKGDSQDILACKIISPKKLRPGWENELEKLSKLRGVPNVVPYFHHGECKNQNDEPVVFILYQFIDGWNLKEYVKIHGDLELVLIEQIIKTVASVLYACNGVNIEHGDLHEGNIMISRPDIRMIGNPPIIWITDFGYGGSHNDLKPKNDFKQLFTIFTALLKGIERSSLNPRDRIVFDKMIEFKNTKVLEYDPTQGRFAGLEALVNEIDEIGRNAEIEVAIEKRGETSMAPGDYLYAEALGIDKNEWQILFVPEILGSKNLLSKNITILTGARGCGKTMTFRRLTAFMDGLIGQSSGVEGSEQFVGFYVNCRDLVEAFPYIPFKTKVPIDDQIIHFFHLLWFAELCKSLAIQRKKEDSFKWLDDFTSKIFPDYETPPKGTDILSYVRTHIEEAKENCRLVRLGLKDGFENWPASRMDFLDLMVQETQKNVIWITKRPFYFFLDDYTLPLISGQTQRILNPILFKRRSTLFFKISTESSNSFDITGVRGKPLELTQDFELIDMANESLHLSKSSKRELLNKIFIPRIKRHHLLKEENFSLDDILGKTPLSNNELSKKMREASQEGKQRKILYQGVDTFVGMWSSDTRTMIQMFVDILKEAENDVALEATLTPIKPSIQDRVFRSAGGEFLKFMEAVTDPMDWEDTKATKFNNGKFGIHLKDIVEAFVNVSRFEMTQGPLISNQGRQHPKQAFRIEILDKFELSPESKMFYNGLTRWHIFLQDWRGKSVRGMLTPRLFINRLLIPYTNLSFSSHDSISLNNEEFMSLLTNPKGFYIYWKDKKKDKLADPKQTNLFEKNEFT